MSRWLLLTRRLFRGSVWLDVAHHLPRPIRLFTRSTENSTSDLGIDKLRRLFFEDVELRVHATLFPAFVNRSELLF